MTDSSSGGNPETFSEIQYINEANRVYEELGSKKSIEHLVLNPPRFLVQEDFNVKLNGAQERPCRLYVFDRLFLVGAEKKSKALSPSDAGTEGSTKYVWFGEKQTRSSVTEESSHIDKESGEVVSVNSSENDDFFDNIKDSELRRQLDVMEDQEKSLLSKKQYDLKLWIDLRKVKIRFITSGGRKSDLGMNISYPTEVREEISPGKFIYNNLVDFFQLVFPNTVAAKSIMGIIQDSIDKISKEILDQQMKDEVEELLQAELESKRTDSEYTSPDSTNPRGSLTSLVGDISTSRSKKNDSGVISEKRISNTTTTSTLSGNSGTSKKKLRKFAKKKVQMRATAAFYNQSPEKREYDEDGNPKNTNVLTPRKIREIYKDYARQKPEYKLKYKYSVGEDADAEFVVLFKSKNMGFSMSSYPALGPFVCRLIDGGQADLAGVTLGDKIIAINETEIPITMDWKECVKIIKDYISQSDTLRVVFVRKQENEVGRVQKEQEKRDALLGDDTDVEENGKVMSVATDDEADVDKASRATSMTSADSDVELQRKSDAFDAISGKKYPRYTIKKPVKKRKRRFARKLEVYNQMQNHLQTPGEMLKFSENKKQLVQLYENNEELFRILKENVTDAKMGGIIYSVHELWMTEKNYMEKLNNFKGFQRRLVRHKHRPLCKDVASGRPYCDHGLKLRRCEKESFKYVRTFPDKDLEKIFKNMASIMKLNYVLWCKLQEKFNELFLILTKEKYLDPVAVVQTVADVFGEFIPFLKMYQVYCQAYPSAAKAYQEYYQSNKKFKEVIDEESKIYAERTGKRLGVKVNVNAARLDSMLVAPVQRITKYHLLFGAIIKHLEKYEKYAKENQDKVPYNTLMLNNLNASMKKNLGELGKVTTVVNFYVGHAEAYQNLVGIFFELGLNKKRINGGPVIRELIEPHRKFDSKYVVHFENTSIDILEPESHMFVFNDMLLFAASKSKRNPSLLGMKIGKRLGLSYGKTSYGKTSKKLSTSTSGSKKKSSLGKANLGKKKHSSYQTSKSSESGRKSVSSVDGKFLEPFFEVRFEEMSKFESIQKKDGEADLYGLRFFYTKKDQHHKGDNEVAQVVLWLGTKDERDGLRGVIEEYLEELKTKGEAFNEARKARKNLKKAKGKRRFKKKHERNKKSLENKSSVIQNSFRNRSRNAPSPIDSL